MERTYPPGVTCWIDVGQPDPERSREFYGDLFGWTFEETPAPYWIVKLDGKDVGGIALDESNPGWATYICTDDMEQAMKEVDAGGGHIVSEPQTIPAATLATAQDPQGAEFRLMKPAKRLGSQVSNIPNAWNFSNLRTDDVPKAFAFYRSLFGWEKLGEDPALGWMVQVPGYGDHLAATVEPDIYKRQAGAPKGFADVIGGIETSSPGEKPNWRVKFSVADRDACAERVGQLGGEVLDKTETQWTFEAFVRDPQGAMFSISQFRG